MTALTSSFLCLAAFLGDREMSGIGDSVLYTVEHTNSDYSDKSVKPD